MFAAVGKYSLLPEGGGIMAAFRQYILTVLCGAMICAVAPLFAGEGKKPLRLICGVFLTVTVVAPILRIDLGALLT